VKVRSTKQNPLLDLTSTPPSCVIDSKSSAQKMLFFDLNEVEFFEGAEKLLEIWFSVEDKSNDNGKELGLRSIPSEEFRKLVRYCNAEVVRSSKNEYIDSYVLSESSMFVAKDHIVMKTCGKTKLLNCVEPLLELTQVYLGIASIQNMFYSRKVYLKPNQQEENYQSFDQEVKLLRKYFPKGIVHTFGRGAEEWYLYTTDHTSDHTNEPDVTLEILMSDLDPRKMSQFIKCHPDDDDRKVTEKSGISDIIPGSVHEGILFDPCGYSMNGLKDNSYSTIHVTPQPHCSYVSYETNIQRENYDQLVSDVLDKFKPGKFIVTLISNKHSKCGSAPAAVEVIHPKGYQRYNLEKKTLKNYSVAYGYYRKDNVV